MVFIVFDVFHVSWRSSGTITTALYPLARVGRSRRKLSPLLAITIITIAGSIISLAIAFTSVIFISFSSRIRLYIILEPSVVGDEYLSGRSDAEVFYLTLELGVKSIE
jgi:hypothetical protein